MGLDVATLRSTFELVVTREPNLTHRFYENLFARYPKTRAMFSRNSRDKQEVMLRDALVAVMDHLEDAPWLERTLTALGTQHRGYGVTDEMYEWVGDSLLVTLAEVAGDDWSPSARAAWTEAYGAIATLMKAGR
jgi:hemoglobin-like flavoprotein